MQNGAADELAQRCGMAAGVSLDPMGCPALDEAEGEALHSTFEDVALLLGDVDQGAGTLFLSNRRVVWAEAGGAAPPHAYAVPFMHITMHAVALASESLPRPSIYMQLDGAEVAADVDDDGSPPEVRLVPSDANQIDALFQALCDGAAANPDPDAESDEGDFFYDEDEVGAGAELDPEHEALFGSFDDMLTIPERYQRPSSRQQADGQFDDASDDDEECAATPDCPCCRPRRR